MANITLKFSIDSAAVSGGRGIKYTASCAAEGAVPSCTPGRLVPQSSGSIVVGTSGTEDIQYVTVSQVPYANATGQYTCAVNIMGDESVKSSCELVNIPPPPVFPRSNVFNFTTPYYQQSLDLLLQSFAAIQSKGPEDPTGWFALAGIHGTFLFYLVVCFLVVSFPTSQPRLKHTYDCVSNF